MNSANGALDDVNDAVDIAVLSSLDIVHVEGEPDLIVELIDLYLEDTVFRLAAMSLHLAQHDALSLRRTAHSLRGSSATLGAARMAQLCDAVEQATQDGPPEVAVDLLHGLEQEFAVVRQALLIERERRTGHEPAHAHQ